MAIPAGATSRDRAAAAGTARANWRDALPRLETRSAVLREVALRDAVPLAASLSKSEVQEYLPVGPTSPAEFARFIRWVRRERRAGRYLCFAVVPHHGDSAAGLFQVWPIEPGFGTAEIGFALDSVLWGTSTFADCARAVLEFGFETLGIRRLEMRSAVANARGAAALRKLGAVAEGTLRQCFPCPGGTLDHTIWSILRADWELRRERPAGIHS